MNQEIIDQITSWEYIKDHIYFKFMRVDDPRFREDGIWRIPCYSVNDFGAWSAYILLESDEKRTVSCPINAELRDKIEYEIETASINATLAHLRLLDICEKNTKKLFPVRYYDTTELGNCLELKELDLANKEYWKIHEKPLYLTVTNKQGLNGAGCIFWEEVQKEVSDFYDSGLLVSFTSIHEAMVHPVNSGIGIQEIEAIMASMEEVVAEEDWLTNKVLYFNREKGCFV